MENLPKETNLQGSSNFQAGILVIIIIISLCVVGWGLFFLRRRCLLSALKLKSTKDTYAVNMEKR